MTTMIFNPTDNLADQHGVVLTYSGGKLLGIVYVRLPLPDLSEGPSDTANGLPNQQPPQQSQQSQPQPPQNMNMANTPTSASGMTPNNMNAIGNNAANLQMLQQLQHRMNAAASMGNQSMNGKTTSELSCLL
jgi:hypothetical protein